MKLEEIVHGQLPTTVMGVVKKEGGEEGREVWHMYREINMMALE